MFVLGWAWFKRDLFNGACLAWACLISLCTFTFSYIVQFFFSRFIVSLTLTLDVSCSIIFHDSKSSALMSLLRAQHNEIMILVNLSKMDSFPYHSACECDAGVSAPRLYCLFGMKTARRKQAELFKGRRAHENDFLQLIRQLERIFTLYK